VFLTRFRVLKHNSPEFYGILESLMVLCDPTSSHNFSSLLGHSQPCVRLAGGSTPHAEHITVICYRHGHWDKDW